MIAASVVVRVDLADLRKRRAELRSKLQAAVRAEAFTVQADAQSRAPVRTGTLRRSIRAEFPTDLSAVIAAHVDYAYFVEYGTHKMAARPYMTPAAEHARRRFPRRIEEALRGA